MEISKKNIKQFTIEILETIVGAIVLNCCGAAMV